MTFKAAFAINARDKEKHVARAVLGALKQTYPCHILLSDQGSTDRTFEVMEETVAAFKMPTRRIPRTPEADIVLDREYDEVPLHKVELLRCPVKDKYGMEAGNAHMDWLVDQTDAEWFVQCSADDYSLPERTRVCMIAAEKNPCACVATTVFFTNPGEEVGPNTGRTGFPLESGYVNAGEGLFKMAYGSTIHAWRRDWLKKVGGAGPCTPDVFYGFLAALDQGFYVVANPQHVHVAHADMNNMGFQGKMRAAELAGDKEMMARINELNRFQLFQLYLKTAERAQKVYPMAHAGDMNAIGNMAFQQAQGWYGERANLHANGWTPGVI